MRPCAHCRAPFSWERKPGQRGRAKIYCSPACSSKAAYARRPKPAVIKASSEEKSQKARKAAEARWTATPKEGRSEAAKHAVATRWAGHEAAPKNPRLPRPCKFCGEVVLMRPTQVRCSKDDCRLAYNASRQGQYEHQRRAIKRSLPAERFDPQEIYERDGWICGICDGPVDRSARHPDPRSVSLDHIVPVSLYGHHVRENVRCAHLGCNVQRGNRIALSDLGGGVSGPTDLGDAGRRLWDQISGTYKLRADELRVLEDAAHEADLIATLNGGLVDAPLLVRGSQGQEVINPLISELRQHRATLASLLRQLKLPDEAAPQQSRSSQAREAVNARWSRRGA